MPKQGMDICTLSDSDEDDDGLFSYLKTAHKVTHVEVEPIKEPDITEDDRHNLEHEDKAELPNTSNKSKVSKGRNKQVQRYNDDKDKCYLDTSKVNDNKVLKPSEKFKKEQSCESAGIENAVVFTNNVSKTKDDKNENENEIVCDDNAYIEHDLVHNKRKLPNQVVNNDIEVVDKAKGTGTFNDKAVVDSGKAASKHSHRDTAKNENDANIQSSSLNPPECQPYKDDKYYLIKESDWIKLFSSIRANVHNQHLLNFHPSGDETNSAISEVYNNSETLPVNVINPENHFPVKSLLPETEVSYQTLQQTNVSKSDNVKIVQVTVDDRKVSDDKPSPVKTVTNPSCMLTRKSHDLSHFSDVQHSGISNTMGNDEEGMLFEVNNDIKTTPDVYVVDNVDHAGFHGQFVRINNKLTRIVHKNEQEILEPVINDDKESVNEVTDNVNACVDNDEDAETAFFFDLDEWNGGEANDVKIYPISIHDDSFAFVQESEGAEHYFARPAYLNDKTDLESESMNVFSNFVNSPSLTTHMDKQLSNSYDGKKSKVGFEITCSNSPSPKRLTFSPCKLVRSPAKSNSSRAGEIIKLSSNSPNKEQVMHTSAQIIKNLWKNFKPNSGSVKRKLLGAESPMGESMVKRKLLGAESPMGESMVKKKLLSVGSSIDEVKEAVKQDDTDSEVEVVESDSEAEDDLLSSYLNRSKIKSKPKCINKNKKDKDQSLSNSVQSDKVLDFNNTRFTSVASDKVTDKTGNRKSYSVASDKVTNKTGDRKSDSTSKSTCVQTVINVDDLDTMTEDSDYTMAPGSAGCILSDSSERCRVSFNKEFKNNDSKTKCKGTCSKGNKIKQTRFNVTAEQFASTENILKKSKDDKMGNNIERSVKEIPSSKLSQGKGTQRKSTNTNRKRKATSDETSQVKAKKPKTASRIVRTANPKGRLKQTSNAETKTSETFKPETKSRGQKKKMTINSKPRSRKASKAVTSAKLTEISEESIGAEGCVDCNKNRLDTNQTNESDNKAVKTKTKTRKQKLSKSQKGQSRKESSKSETETVESRRITSKSEKLESKKKTSKSEKLESKKKASKYEKEKPKVCRGKLKEEVKIKEENKDSNKGADTLSKVKRSKKKTNANGLGNDTGVKKRINKKQSAEKELLETDNLKKNEKKLKGGKKSGTSKGKVKDKNDVTVSKSMIEDIEKWDNIKNNKVDFLHELFQIKLKDSEIPNKLEQDRNISHSCTADLTECEEVESPEKLDKKCANTMKVGKRKHQKHGNETNKITDKVEKNTGLPHVIDAAETESATVTIVNDKTVENDSKKQRKKSKKSLNKDEPDLIKSKKTDGDMSTCSVPLSGLEIESSSSAKQDRLNLQKDAHKQKGWTRRRKYENSELVQSKPRRVYRSKKVCRQNNERWKEMLQDEAFKFDFDKETQQTKYKPLNVKAMLRKILKPSPRSSVESRKQKRERDIKRKLKKMKVAGMKQKMENGSRMRETSESEEMWMSDTGQAEQYPAFKFSETGPLDLSFS